MLYKKTPSEVKDLDEKKGIVIAYPNAYNNRDEAGDISAPGSFVKTVKENGRRIRVLKDHIQTISLGVPLEFWTDDPFGLKTATQFNMKKEVARDMFTDVQLALENNMTAELSIGYDVAERDEKNTAIIKQYKLWEYSFLTSWACNALATVEGLKHIHNTYGVMELLQKMYNLQYSDPTLRKIERILVSLDQRPGQGTTGKSQPITSLELANKIRLTYTNAI